MKAFVKFKEVGKPGVKNTTYVGQNLTTSFIIDFFGLEENDVAWYKVEIED